MCIFRHQSMWKAKDRTGQKVRLLTFVRPTAERRKGNVVWELKCDCGTNVLLSTNDVLHNGITSCGCNYDTRTVDYTGQKFNRLTFIRQTDKRKGGRILWELNCDCGSTIHHSISGIITGKTRSCGCYEDEHRVENSSKSRIYSPIESSARAVWGRYKDGCDFATFFKLSQEACYYCGNEPSRTYNTANTKTKRSPLQKSEGNFTYNGLDRLDSTKNHSPDNVVPCCTNCNYAKRKLTVDEFISMVERIYHHTRKIR